MENFTENLIGMEMMWIPGGSFDMGSDYHSSEQPVHCVTVPGFFMGKFPITQVQYRTLKGSNPSYFQGENLPVEQVNWYEASEFCRLLSVRTEINYRLPSEAEWEYACRAGTTTAFHFGDTITTDQANYDGSYAYSGFPKGVFRGMTTAVGSFPPNAFGLYDMHGNVWEWCADKWNKNYHGAPTEGSVWESGNHSHVVRGGSWGNVAVGCRAANRGRHDPDDRHSLIGFRVVCASGART